MIRFLYTGVFKEGDDQKSPTKSLGGHVSGTAIPNGLTGSIFGDSNRYEQERRLRAIVIQNDNIAKTGFKVWIEAGANAIGKYQIAIVALAEDDCGWYMERVDNENALPFIGTFSEVSEEADAIVIGDFDANAYYGIWIIKTIDADTIKQQLNCSNLHLNYQNDEQLASVEPFSIHLAWD